MTPQEYIKFILSRLNQTENFVGPTNKDDLKTEILRLLLSKKFRKYSANEDLINHCKQVVSDQVDKGEPINITFLHGAYKLWRLDESPNPDWAELFSFIYYTNWVKGICTIYEPGVWFDNFADDWIVPMMDNVPQSDVDTYISGYESLLAFLKPHQPKNLQMTITPVGSHFESKEVFKEKVQAQLQVLQSNGLPEISDGLSKTIDLNVKTTEEQEADPEWREKVWQLHLAYGAVKKSVGYHDGRTDKILAFTQPLSSGKTISVGTTKSSVAKFWVGVGALKKVDNAFKEVILTPNQLQDDQLWEDISIEGLSLPNFNKIRIVS